MKRISLNENNIEYKNLINIIILNIQYNYYKNIYITKTNKKISN